MLPLIRYIHRNPVRAGLTGSLGGYAWSSHKGYLTSSEKWNWLYKEFILAMLSVKKVNRFEAYRQFVSQEDEEGTVGILEKTKWPSVLGSEDFENRITHRFYPRKIDEEVPQSKELAPEAGWIRKGVCGFYGIGEEELMKSRRGVINEPRNVAIYLTRQLRGDCLSQIGEHFRMRKYSSVSSVVERIKQRMGEDRELRSRIERLISRLTKSQEQT